MYSNLPLHVPTLINQHQPTPPPFCLLDHLRRSKISSGQGGPGLHPPSSPSPWPTPSYHLDHPHLTPPRDPLSSTPTSPREGWGIPPSYVSTPRYPSNPHLGACLSALDAVLRAVESGGPLLPTIVIMLKSAFSQKEEEERQKEGAPLGTTVLWALLLDLLRSQVTPLDRLKYISPPLAFISLCYCIIASFVVLTGGGGEGKSSQAVVIVVHIRHHHHPIRWNNE